VSVTPIFAVVVDMSISGMGPTAPTYTVSKQGMIKVLFLLGDVINDALELRTHAAV
jgi:hypothetical protein